ncbi:hypothetical protein EDD18DRAFT_233586 [Armillaria luteobubalina]|uniref:Uncharacterized protein n=1 Tax=Armillaria luteobubalina TaxID=153913 RepID=A0AA39Q775_9AGAR|nr:hypothetical protein EDD18DRAFT_233586 [Armillaria luteobubalina]
MCVQTGNLPADPTDDDIFNYLDAELNSIILYAILHGIYTGIVAVTLWNIFMNNSQPLHRQSKVFMVIMLYNLTTLHFAFNWSCRTSAFIGNGQTSMIVYQELIKPIPVDPFGTRITASICTIISNSHTIWCCWVVWLRRWSVVLLPALFLISGTGLRLAVLCTQFGDGTSQVFNVLYISFNLATTLWCTIFIIYRILTIVHVRYESEGRLGPYRRFIEVFVESSAIYAIPASLYLAFILHDTQGVFYLDSITNVTKGIAPTLFVGRAAAGHTRANESLQESAVSSLRFRMSFGVDTETGTQENTMQSDVLEDENDS